MSAFVLPLAINDNCSYFRQLNNLKEIRSNVECFSNAKSELLQSKKRKYFRTPYLLKLIGKPREIPFT